MRRMTKSLFFLVMIVMVVSMGVRLGFCETSPVPSEVVAVEETVTASEIPRWHGIGVKPIYGFEAWEIRKDVDGKYVGALNTGAYFGAGVDIKLPDNAFLNWLDPQIEFGIHPEVLMGDDKFRIAFSGGIGLWTIFKSDDAPKDADGSMRVINFHIKKDLTGVPPGAGDTISYAFTVGFALGKGGA